LSWLRKKLQCSHQQQFIFTLQESKKQLSRNRFHFDIALFARQKKLDFLHRKQDIFSFYSSGSNQNMQKSITNRCHSITFQAPYKISIKDWPMGTLRFFPATTKRVH
jgi:hypothetical protein